jgi:hypothetical protein
MLDSTESILVSCSLAPGRLPRARFASFFFSPTSFRVRRAHLLRWSSNIKTTWKANSSAKTLRDQKTLLERSAASCLLKRRTSRSLDLEGLQVSRTGCSKFSLPHQRQVSVEPNAVASDVPRRHLYSERQTGRVEKSFGLLPWLQKSAK